MLTSYTRARAENTIASCKVGFLERPERTVLIIIGALTNHMAPVLWVIAVLSNITVIHRIAHTLRETRQLDEADKAAESETAKSGPSTDTRPGSNPEELHPGSAV